MGEGDGERLPRTFDSPWQRVSSRAVYQARSFVVREDEVITPAGTPGRYQYFEARHPIAAVAALDDERHIYLVRQWRYPWQRDSWELPAGSREEGEDPLEVAKRELLEEAGVTAARWTSLGTFFGTASGTMHFNVFLAEGLSHGEARRDAEEGDMIVRRVPLEEALAAAEDGRIVHAATISTLFRLTRFLARRSHSSSS